MDEQDPFAKAGKWNVPGRKPPEPPLDVTRPMTPPADNEVTRVRSAAPPRDDEATRVRPARPAAEPAAPPVPAAAVQPGRKRRWPVVAAAAALISVALYIVLGR